MPDAERMLGEFAAQLARERTTAWRFMGEAADAAALECKRLKPIVDALAAMAFGVEALRPADETQA